MEKIKMSDIIIRKSNEHRRDKINDALKKVISFLSPMYPGVDFDRCDFIFGNGTRSRYFRNENNIKYSKPTCFISCRSLWLTYQKKSLKLTANMKIPVHQQIEFALVHELTHHAQYELDRLKGSEVETTRNELEYCKVNYPKLYNKLSNI